MVFDATHVVPQGGIPAWGEPDPSNDPSVNLAAGTELRAGEQRGQWTRVEAENGWTGWVDANQIVARPSTPSAPPPGASGGPVGNPRNVGVSILLAIVTLGIYTYVWTYKTHKEIKDHSGIGVGGPIGFVIYLLISPVTFFIVPSETRQMYEQNGWESPVTGLWGLWFLLPLIGALVWFVKVQGALNDFWVAKGASPV